ncbi:sugar transferase [Microbacterium hominis]|uniref:Sugar transferase n=1 Tax=Microbacterium hominis TaxID=162426 RepID=A0A7D4PNI2_9MICO|nr:sugar transferase [Microbacterium hominis]QKJ20290.1 sugar transferase [Microbacterium hominis]
MSSALEFRSTAALPPNLGEVVSTVAEVAPQPRRLGWRRRLQWGMAATDAAVIALAVYVAQLVRFGAPGLGPTMPGIASVDVAYGVMSIVLATIWLVSLSATRSRMLRNIGTGMVEYQRVLQATLGTFGVFAIVAFLGQLEIARGYLAIALPLGLALLIVSRAVWRTSLHRMRLVGRCMTGAIVVGGQEDVLRVLHQLRRNYRVGYRAIAVSVPGGRPAASTRPASSVRAMPFIPFDEVAAVSKRRRARAVIVAGGLPGGNEAIRRLGWELENSQVELILMSRLTDVAGPRIHMRPINGLPMVHVDLPQYSGYSHAVKRLFDVSLVSVALLLLAPVFAAIALAVRLDSPGPVIFRQERVGAHGSRFTMLKFRSMVTDAEARLADLQAQSDGNGVLFKMKDDPRVTRVGAFLRAYSLDELPQLWNVLRGDMSLVGPRPPLPAEVEQYEAHVSRRLLTRPGITGLWQVNGRSNLSWEESVRLDLYYVENWSITGDIIVLAKTVKAVVRSDGAY